MSKTESLEVTRKMRQFLWFIKSIYFVLICILSENSCICRPSVNNVMNISSLNTLAEQFTNYVYQITQDCSGANTLVHFTVPTDKDRPKMMYVIEKTIQNISSSWSVISNDIYCSDTIEELIRSYYSKPLDYTPDVYVVPIFKNTSIKRFEIQLEKMYREDSFNPKATMVLIQLTERCDERVSKDEAAEIFNFLWDLNSFTSIMFVMAECDLAVTMISGKPFTNENRCRRVEKDGLKYFQLPQGVKNISTDLYKREKMNNLNGCLFWAGAVPYPPYIVGKPIALQNEILFEDPKGIDIEIMHLFTRKLNFTFRYIRPHALNINAWFGVLPNGTIIGILQDMMLHKVDLTFAGVMPSYVTYYKFDYSTSYKFTSFSLYIPDANILPQWLIILKAFSVIVWISLGITFVIVCLTYYAMNTHSVSNLNVLEIPLMDLFSIIIGFSSNLRPKTIYLRVLFFFWTWYSMHMYIAYTTILYILLANPPLEKEIQTLQELQASGLKVTLDSIYMEAFKPLDFDITTKAILNNHIVCNNMEQCSKELIKNRNFSLFGSEETFAFLFNSKRVKLRKLPDNVMTYFISFVTTKGSVLSQGLSSMISHLFQAGLITKWEKDVGWTHRLLNNKNFDLKEPGLEPLSIKNLKGAFYIIFVGISIALAVFSVEILFHKLIKSKKSYRLICEDYTLKKNDFAIQGT